MDSQRVGIGRAFAWFVQGWNGFRAQPGPWIALFLLYVVAVLALNLVPVLGGLLATLLAPAFGAGLLLAARDASRGDPVRLGHLFEGLADARSRGRLLGLGGLALAASFLLAGLFLGMAETLPEPDAPPTQGPFLVESGLAGLVVLLLGMGVVAAFYFATPLVTFTPSRPLGALGASLRAVLRNLLSLLLFGLVYAALAAVAAIPYGLGFLILGPVGAGAAYASFTEVFPHAHDDPQEPEEEVSLPA
ncbi:MAG: BPSS1780 family membrane protein [Thiohalorhabdus sp.]|uniref:BPSS1780 family membrane protein n=1 Tax=Thiohalorhabdus sp. TaxID=3094134 RepID=UPI003980C874